MQSIRFKMNEELWRKLHLLCNPPVILNGKIGEEVRWNENNKSYGDDCAGVIVGHYKNSYKVERYAEVKTGYTYDGVYETTTYTFTKNNFFPKIYNLKDPTLYSEDIASMQPHQTYILKYYDGREARFDTMR